MGLGMPIPDLSNKPGPGRPGWPGDTGAYEFQFEVTDNVTFKAIANSTGTFSISYPDGTTTTTSGSSSITSQGGAGIISINKEEGDTTFCDEFAIVGNKDKVIKVISWGKRTWNKLQDAFKDCTNLTEISTTSLTTDTTGNLNNLFSGCTSLTDVSIKGWNLLSGCSIEGLFDGCTNIEKLNATGLALKIKASSRSIFKEVGSTVATGCEFLMSGLDFSTSTSMTFGDTFGNGMFQGVKIKPNSNFSNWNLTSSATTQLNSIFLNAKILGDNSTLNISNWTLLGTTSSRANGFFNNFETSDGTNRGLNIDITNWNFGNIYSVTDFFKNCDLSTVTGLSTLTASNIEYLGQFFQFAKYLSIPSTDNLSSSFRNAVNAAGAGFNNFAQNLGSSLTNESDWGAFPNVDGFNLSNATVFTNIFAGGRYSTGINLGNVTFPATAVSFSGIFASTKLSAGNGIDLTTTTLKSSNFQNFLQNTVADFMKMGTGVDWTSVTTMYGFNQNWNLTRPGGAVANSIELPTGLNISSLNAIGLWGFDANYSQCQIDNFIRSMWLYQRPPVPSTPTLNFSGGAGLTAAPMVVRSKVDDLITAGWNFNGEASPDITAPFAYTGSFLINTNITPTINTSGGKFSSNDVTVDEDTGVFNTSTAVNATIRYTFPDGCYNEQVLNVVPPFSPFKFRVTGPISIKAQPAATGSFTIDWGDGTSQTTTGSNSIASPNYPAGTYDVQINALGDATYCDEFAIVSGQTNVTKVLDWGEKPWSNMGQAFANCDNLTSISETVFTAAAGCNVRSMLNNCDSLTIAKINNWNLSAGIDAYEGLIRNCDNLEELDATNLVVKFSSISGGRTMFGNNGNSVTNGCLFKMSGMDFSSTTVNLSGGNTTINMFSNCKFADGSDLSNWNFPATWNGTGFFSSSKIVGTNAVLNISNWDNYPGTSLSFSGMNSLMGDTGAKINLTNLNLSNFNNMFQMFYFTDLSQIIGISTWNATAGNVNAYRAFWGSNFLSVTPTDNFSNAFIQSLTPTNVVQMFQSFGNDNENVAVNLNGLDLSNITDFNSFMSGAKFSTAPDFSNVTFPSTAISWSYAFYGFDLPDAATSVLNFSNVTAKISSLAYTFSGCGVNEIKFGNNVDFSQLTSFNNTFYNPPRLNNPQFPTNANFGAVTDFYRMFYSSNSKFSTCQADNFIRRIHATAFSNNGNIPLNNSQVTEAPSVVQSKLQELTTGAGGWSITVNNTDATIPFEYTGSLAPNTPITPTNNTGSAFTGTFTSSNSNIAVNSSTGVINSPNGGSTTIRYTLADGCYTEQAIELVSAEFSYSASAYCQNATDPTPTVTGTSGGTFTAAEKFFPFQMQFEVASGTSKTITIPDTVGSSYTVDWGDGATTTETGGDISHTYNDGTNTDVTNPVVSIGAESDTGPFTTFKFNDAGSADDLLDVPQWGSIVFTTLVQMFKKCQNTSFQISATDAPKITSTGSSRSMAYMFNNADYFNSDISHWDISNITGSGSTVRDMFNSADNFNQNLSSWNIQTTSAYAMLGSNGMSTENFTDTIVGWAVTVYKNSGLYNVGLQANYGRTFDCSRTSDNASGQTYAAKYGSDWTATGWTDAGDALDYLTGTTANWTISNYTPQNC